MKFVMRLMVQETHLDFLGHMNNATYLEILEQARWEMVTDRGFGIKEIQQQKKGPVILQINIRFLKELMLRESIEIHTTPEKMNSKIGKVKQEIFNSKNELACEAEFTIGFMDLVERKLISASSEWNRALGFES
jgi:YbgC/YbaW family acyl-CoA thioester hydrolase